MKSLHRLHEVQLSNYLLEAQLVGSRAGIPDLFIQLLAPKLSSFLTVKWQQHYLCVVLTGTGILVSLCVFCQCVWFFCVYVYDSVNSDPVSRAQTWDAHLDLHSYPTTYQRQVIRPLTFISQSRKWGCCHQFLKILWLIMMGNHLGTVPGQ